MCTFKLRPHHALCIQFFDGKGYSDEFTVHMRKIINSMTKEAMVKIIDGNDDICGKCPNLSEGICVTQDKVCRYDRKVMEICGFHAGQVLTVKDFSETAKRDIIDKHRLKEVCGDCAWKCGQEKEV